jgi:hypothetical protein
VLPNSYVQLKVQLNVHVFIRILYSSLFLALHVSCAICTHPQEHRLQGTAIGVCNVYGMLIHWSRYWLGQSIAAGTGWDSLLQQVLTGTVYCSRYWLGQSIAAGTGWDSLLQQVLARTVYCSRYWLEQSIAAGTVWDSLL